MTKQIPLPQQETLLDLLDYDPDTGVLTWRNRAVSLFNDGKQTAAHNCAVWNSRYSGEPAGCTRDNGYIVTAIFGVKFMSHRAIWKMMTGTDPDQIDHIDGCPGNNRFTNLRDVSQSENSKNQRIRSTNTSSVQGVFWDKPTGKWRSQITVDGRKVHLGLFDNLDAAAAARAIAENEHGYHENHGRSGRW